MQETQVQSQHWWDPLEKEMATQSLENYMDEGAWWATAQGLQRVRQDWACMHAQQPYKLGSIIIPILQMRKSSLGELSSLPEII